MRKTMIYLPDELHEALRELAVRHKTSLTELVRQAVEQTYEEELDGFLMERELDEYLRDPSTAISLEEYRKRHALRRPANA